MHGFVASVALFAGLAAPAAAEAPYQKFATAVGTPQLAASYAPGDKSRMLLKFVPGGQSVGHWTKLTTISIVTVPARDSDGAVRGVVRTLRSALQKRHAKQLRFDESSRSPASAYFMCTAGGQAERGIVYSPHPGFVAVAQIDVKNGGTIHAGDVKYLKTIIGRS